MTDQQRFDTITSFRGQQRPLDRSHTDPEWMDKRQGVPWHLEERFHSDVFIGQSAVSWIRNHKGEQPLFLQIGFTGPHEPWDPLPRHLALYEGREMPKGPCGARASWKQSRPSRRASANTTFGCSIGWPAAPIGTRDTDGRGSERL